MPSEKPTWRLIGEYGVKTYKCGLSAGDLLRLKRDLVCLDHNGKPTGEVISNQLPWRVLTGSPDDPGIVYLLQPNGERHTWDDDQSIYEYFEKVSLPSEAS